MDKNIISTFKFLHYCICDINFKVNQNNCFDANNDTDIDMGFEVAIARKREHLEQVRLSVFVEVFKDYLESGAPFNLRFTIDGYFEVEQDMTDDELSRFCKSSGVPILFPYIRSAVTDITKIANIEPLVLPLINVRRLVEEPELIEESKK